jgi:ABC-type multidrug transport system ATPase subunit
MYTTPTDPVTRRSVWDCINRAKKGRVIILTTHSMEEADILGDRVAVMSGGQLSCIGTSLHLKNKFGGGFRLSLIAPSANAPQVKEMVCNAPGVGAKFVSETQGLFLFRLANADATSLQKFFEDLEARKAELGVSDLSIGNATLDDVFINLALAEEKDQGEETAAAALKAGGIKQAGPTVTGGGGDSGSGVVVAQPAETAQLSAAGIKQAGPTTTATAGSSSNDDAEHGCCNAACCEKCFFGPSRYCCDCGCCSCECACLQKKTSSKDDAANSAAGDKDKLGKPQSQVAALVKKSIAFQLRQKKMMCCIIMFPTLFIVLIALLGTLVFDPLTADALAKYNWDCMQDLVKQTSYSGPGISVGGISDKNPQYENNDWPPLHGLETPSFTYYVSYPEELASGVGEQSLGEQEVLPWEREYLAQFPKLKDCQDAYDEAYDAAVAEVTSEAEVDSLSYAKTWASYGNTTQSVTSYPTCKDGNDEKTKTTVDLRLKQGDGTGAPRPSKLAWHVYLNLTQTFNECKEKVSPMQSFNNSKSEGVLDTQAATSAVSGILEHLSFAPIQESLVKSDFNSRMYTALGAYALATGSTCGYSNSSKECDALGAPCVWNFLGVGTCDFAPGDVASGAPSSAPSHIATYLCAEHNTNLNQFATGALGYGLVSGDESYTTVGSARVDAFCTWHADLDSARGTRASYAGTSRSDLNALLYDDWEGTWDEATATHLTKFTSYHFAAANSDTQQYDFTAYFNLSGLCGFYGGDEVECENSAADAPVKDYLPSNPVTDMLLTVQSRMSSAVLTAAAGMGVDVGLKTFPQILDKCLYDPLGCNSIVDFIATVFLPYIFLIYVYVIQGLVVFEKSSHLRDIMVMSGLKMRVYWTVLWAFYFVQYMAMVFVLWAAGAATGLNTFTIHDPLVLLLFFVLWGQCMIAFSFMLTTFFQSPRTATVVLLLVTVLSVQAGTTLLVQNIINPLVGDDETPYLPYMWFPPLVMLRCILWLAYGAAFNAPCTLANLGTYGNSAVSRCFWYMFVETFIMAGLTYYLEAVLAAGGAARHPLFCVADLKALFMGSNKEGGGALKSGESQAEIEMANLQKDMEEARESEPDDVKAERERAQAGGDNQAVRVLNFRKVFAGQHGGAEKVAVRDLSFAVNKNECFGLLGHNGAGKTTCISMLCGLHKPTAGRATVAGFDLDSEMASVYENMGVCPQHDILWNDLTAREHLLFFARLRKIPEGALDAAVLRALDAVNLKEWADVLSSKFSGGMKRRLSTACSLVGEPKVVYMDEPSTGLDPASRHRLWEVIAQSKGKNSILLTTHSMEEADVLCERIGIMGAGSMLCLGTSLDLKARFGAGYRLSLHIADKSAKAAQEAQGVVVKLCPSAKLLNEPLGGILDFEVPRVEVQLSKVYGAIEDARESLGILDWGITESTLEEVFLAVTGHEAHTGVVPDTQAVTQEAKSGNAAVKTAL